MTTYTKKAFQIAQGVEFKDNLEFFDHLVKCGCYLDDICHTPVDHLPKSEREAMLNDNIDDLSNRIKRMNPDVVLIMLKKIKNHVKEALIKAGIKPHIYVLPFA